MSWFEWLEWWLLLAGLAVVHLMWQTFVAGAVVAGLARLADRASAQLRYSVALALFLILPVIALSTIGLIAATAGTELASGSGAQTFPGSESQVAIFAPWIGLLWAAGLMLGIGRFLSGALSAARIARAGSSAGAALIRSTNRQVERLGIRRPVSVRVSRNVRVPSVVGLWSPTLLMPSWILGDLDQDEIDAIIAHELSHVRRWDLHANAAQRIASALLFFHPVAAWISRTIDREREVCCDDIVTRIGVPRFTYARALARVALNGWPQPAAGLGVATGDVAARVRRLMGPTPLPEKRHVVAPILSIVVVTLASVSIMTRASFPLTTHFARTTPAWEARVLADVEGFYTVNATDPAGEFTVSIENGRAVGASIAGTALSDERIRQRGARVTLYADHPRESFSVQILPTGGIKWPARASHAPN